MKMKLALTFLFLGLLTGCAGTLKSLPDGRVLSAVTVGDTLDRSATYVQILEPTGETNEDGSPKYMEVAGDLTVGTTVAGDAIKGAVPAWGAAYIQGEAARSVAKTKAAATQCPPGSTNCHSTVVNTVVDGAEAMAGSSAASQSGVIFDAVFSNGCPSGNCVSVPMD